MKLTSVYPGVIKPIRRGVYQRLYSSTTKGEIWLYAFFDGIYWRGSSYNPEIALHARYVSAFQSLEWRGVAK